MESLIKGVISTVCMANRAQETDVSCVWPIGAHNVCDEIDGGAEVEFTSKRL